MAYISISSTQKLQHGNEFMVNGSDPVRIFGAGSDTYKVKDGSYHVVIRSANGDAWECDADLSVRRASSACLSVRLAVDGNGNIVDMEYAVFYLNMQQEGAYMVFPKLKLSYSAPTQKEKPDTAAAVEDEEYLDEIPADDEEYLDELPVDDTDIPVAPPAGVSSKKKGGTGWIVFGVICLLTAVANITKIPTLIGCGVLGAISLIVGIKKKKG